MPHDVSLPKKKKKRKRKKQMKRVKKTYIDLRTGILYSTKRVNHV